MEVVSFVLTAFGALGGIFWAVAYFMNHQKRRRALRALAEAPHDFYYKSLDTGARIGNKGRQWNALRRATVVSERDGLDNIEIGTRPLNKTQGHASLSPDTLKLVQTANVNGFERFQIQPDHPLNEGMEVAFVLQYPFEKVPDASGKDFFSWRSNRRVDDLCLRVLFEDHPPMQVLAQITDTSSRVVQHSQVRPDPLTHEYRWPVGATIRNLTYALVWDLPKEP